jgi:hypothetical protein
VKKVQTLSQSLGGADDSYVAWDDAVPLLRHLKVTPPAARYFSRQSQPHADIALPAVSDSGRYKGGVWESAAKRLPRVNYFFLSIIIFISKAPKKNLFYYLFSIFQYFNIMNEKK